MSVLFSHFVQIVVPFGLFAPEPIAAVAGALIILHQLLLIVSGNYAWLNWLTVVLAFAAFSDRTLGALHATPPLALQARPFAFELLLYALALGTAVLSVKPALNLCSKAQAMNASYNSFHLVGSYGAFGSITRKRHEIVLEGTDEHDISEHTIWREYEFKGKPSDPSRRPRQWAPYHLRLDWLMWFLPLRIVPSATRTRIRHELWFARLAEKLLEGDRATLALLRPSPFATRPPKHVRASIFLYQLTSPLERKQTGLIWKRTRIGEYLPAIALPDTST
jgi:hypothetical protein